MNVESHLFILPTSNMDAASSKAAALASAKVVKNAKGNIVPSSQKAHIVYGCGTYLRLCEITANIV